LATPARREPYAYRDDARVPAFDDAAPIAVVDGECALCAAGARLIDRFDRSATVRVCATQSPLGRALLSHFGLDADDPDSWLYLVDGCGYGALDGVLKLAPKLGPLGWLLRPLHLLPGPVAVWIYARAARNRYRLFGAAALCASPTPGLRARLIA